MKRIAMIMVNHNGGEEVLRSATSVVDDLSEDDKLILIDNGSSDDSWKKVKEKLTSVECFHHDKNLPFAAANNIGIEWAMKKKYEYIGIINPDVRVKPGMFDLLLSRLKNSSNQMAVSPIICYESPADKIWYAGGKIWWLFAWVSHRGQGKNIDRSIKFQGKTDYLTGCCWLTTANVWREVGPMDDRYGMYAEDVDWSWRARMKGVELFVDASAYLIHRISQSSGGGRSDFKMKYRTLATRLFFKRYTSYAFRIPQKILTLAPKIMYSLLLLFQGEFSAFKSYFTANFEGIGESIPWHPTDQ